MASTVAVGAARPLAAEGAVILETHPPGDPRTIGEVNAILRINADEIDLFFETTVAEATATQGCRPLAPILEAGDQLLVGREVDLVLPIDLTNRRVELEAGEEIVGRIGGQVGLRSRDLDHRGDTGALVADRGADDGLGAGLQVNQAVDGPVDEVEPVEVEVGVEATDEASHHDTGVRRVVDATVVGKVRIAIGLDMAVRFAGVREAAAVEVRDPADQARGASLPAAPGVQPAGAVGAAVGLDTPGPRTGATSGDYVDDPADRLRAIQAALRAADDLDAIDLVGCQLDPGDVVSAGRRRVHLDAVDQK